jgi:sulfopyruvate decarboxylase alpha subunit
MNNVVTTGKDSNVDWPQELFEQLKAADIRQVAYVPDAGHSRLIDMVRADSQFSATVLTTEEEGIGVLSGAWLGGQRGVLLMQSSGVGNCINTLALTQMCRFPLLMLVTMRGEWAEQNPWQVPMGKATGAALELMDLKVYRAETSSDVVETVDAALELVFNSEQAVAVLLSQRLLGRKKW